MPATATKKSSCPRCHGTGTIEENITLVGIAPLLDRPSGVNDDDWFSILEPEVRHANGVDPTVVREVPVFRLPPAHALGRLRPPPPSDLTPTIPPGPPRTATTSHPRPRRRRGVGVLFAAIVVGASLGAFAAIHGDTWMPSVARVVHQVRGANHP